MTGLAQRVSHTREASVQITGRGLNPFECKRPVFLSLDLREIASTQQNRARRQTADGFVRPTAHVFDELRQFFRRFDLHDLRQNLRFDLEFAGAFGETIDDTRCCPVDAFEKCRLGVGHRHDVQTTGRRRSEQQAASLREPHETFVEFIERNERRVAREDARSFDARCEQMI